MITRAVGSSWCASCSCSAQASFHRSLRMKRRTFAVLATAVIAIGCRDQRLLQPTDRKSTRLNSSHTVISYAVFCLKKKNQSHEHKTISTHYDNRKRMP